MQIRKIALKDNSQVAHLIRSTLEEMGVPKVGTAYGDKALDRMFQTYRKSKSVFYIAENGEEVIGCGGIAPLDNYDGNICELQKMYVSKEARGKGIATQLLEACLASAREFGFEACYLETMPYMNAAQGLYQKKGFTYIKEALGDTGHHACTVRMLNTF